MKRITLYSIALSILSFTTSCVPTKELLAVQDDLKAVQGDYQSAREQLSASNARVSALEQQLKECQESKADLQVSLNSALSNASNYNTNVQKLVDQVNESNTYIRNLHAAKAHSDSLNVVLTNQLTGAFTVEEMRDVAIERKNSEIVLTFTDNILYNIGTYDISERGAEVLQRVASQIKSNKDLEVIVESNSTSLPITDDNIQHNWDLAVTRAVAVVKHLQKYCGVDAKQLSASGRAEFESTDGQQVMERKLMRTTIILRPKTTPILDMIK